MTPAAPASIRPGPWRRLRRELGNMLLGLTGTAVLAGVGACAIMVGLETAAWWALVVSFVALAVIVGSAPH